MTLKQSTFLISFLMAATFVSNTANAQLKTFLKLDHFSGVNNCSTTNQNLDYLVSKKIKAVTGFTANRRNKSSLNVFSPYLNATNDKGEQLFEVWHQGLDYINTKFDATGFGYKKNHFDAENRLIKEYLRGQMHSFGAPDNHVDSTVASIVIGNIHLVGDGASVVAASQMDDARNKSADGVSKTLTLNKKMSQLDPNKSPSSNFDLKDWKLQTINTADNTLKEITATNLVAGYSSDLFYTDSGDGSLVFKVPSNGATTSGAGYPRCELRQMSAGANWALSDATEHYLYAECKVTQVANAKPQIIIGQIHGSEINSEMIKLRWSGNESGKCFVEARFEDNDAIKAEYGVKLATGLSLGDLITYSITMKSGKITVTVNGTSASQTYTSDYFGTTDAYYFKAGNYFQYNNLIVPDPTLIYGQTKFYKLTLDKTLGTKRFDMSDLKYYPNPVESILTLDYTNLIHAIQVYNASGQSVLKSFPNTINPQIDMSLLPKGIYYVEVLSDDKREIIKVIKN